MHTNIVCHFLSKGWYDLFVSGTSGISNFITGVVIYLLPPLFKNIYYLKSNNYSVWMPVCS
jgi:hypothetical protein